MAKFTDTKIAAYLCDPNFRNIDWWAKEHTDINKVDEQFYPHLMALKTKKTYEECESGTVQNQLQDGKLGIIMDMEMSLVPVLADMEATGIAIDSNLLAATGMAMEKRCEELETQIFALSGSPFNINSTKQLQEMLFEKMKLPTVKKNKTGQSVDSETLEKLALNFPIAALISEYRTLKKLQSTYVQGLIKAKNPDTLRIHTTFVQTQTSTGRLSSENPNLQNIPSGNAWSDAIKQAFIPRSGYCLLVADYSQVELRILAAMSEDPLLISTFLRGEDIHRRTALSIFGEDATITSDMRRQAKAVNFGVIYGISGFGLSKMLNIPAPEASRYIQTFFGAYPQTKVYQDTLLAAARTDYFVSTYFGRRRYIKEINDPNMLVRTHAEREAINMPIQ